ncbi:MAG: ATP-binding protein [Fibrobacterota bacterium]
MMEKSTKQNLNSYDEFVFSKARRHLLIAVVVGIFFYIALASTDPSPVKALFLKIRTGTATILFFGFLVVRFLLRSNTFSKGYYWVTSCCLLALICPVVFLSFFMNLNATYIIGYYMAVVLSFFFLLPTNRLLNINTCVIAVGLTGIILSFRDTLDRNSIRVIIHFYSMLAVSYGLVRSFNSARFNEYNITIAIKKELEKVEKAEERLKNEINEKSKIEKKLKQSNTELEQFAYVASHDLQEPLRMVASYLQLIEKRYKDKLDSEANEFIAYAVDGAVRMRNLINDLLAYSRISTKGRPLTATKCEEAFNKAIKNLEIAIHDKHAKITSDSLPIIIADEGQLIQLFQNLIGNALKFCKDGTPEAHVLVEKKEKEYLFGVRDNGIGIVPEDKERVFQIFQRLHTREEYEGTGIGLAVCKKIVERHGGRIWIDSVLGQGTTFWFTIPI